MCVLVCRLSSNQKDGEALQKWSLFWRFRVKLCRSSPIVLWSIASLALQEKCWEMWSWAWFFWGGFFGYSSLKYFFLTFPYKPLEYFVPASRRNGFKPDLDHDLSGKWSLTVFYSELFSANCNLVIVHPKSAPSCLHLGSLLPFCTRWKVRWKERFCVFNLVLCFYLEVM